MESFLEKLIYELNQKHPQGLGEVCIVFPTQRAGLFFRKHLARHIKQPVWAPEVLSVENFFRTLSGSEVPDQLTLVMELFDVYKIHFPDETFDRFYHWGSMMIKDFDEIDRYMVDARLLFKNIKDLKEIDEEFGFDAEELEALKRFWEAFLGNGEDLSKIKQSFIKTWSCLYDVYSKLKENLGKKNWAYEGMVYRHVAENLKDAESRAKKWKHVVFAGLYDLSPSEERLINHLVLQGNASCYWDADSYYTDTKNYEAGNFFRNSKLTQGDFLWKEDAYASLEKKISIIGAPQAVGQAKTAGLELQMIAEQPGFIAENTALVLPDENMLFPVLHSIPEEIKTINVTMGYPLKSTPLASLLFLIGRMQKNQKKGSFYHSDVIQVLNHPYIQYLDKDNSPLYKWKQEYLETGWIYLSHKHLSGEGKPAFFSTLFQRPESTDEVINYLLGLLNLLQKSIESKRNSNRASLESEMIFQYFSHLKRLHGLVQQYKTEISGDILWSLFNEITGSVRIPFSGEPLNGLQIMGFLETRALDFENVFILANNEGTLPAPMRSHSFIPFAIRKAFGMNTHEHHDSRYAYYFYRLLQRAKNIYLLYNTEAKSVTGGEKSRYIMQIEQELQKRFPRQVNILHKQIAPEISKPKAEPITIEKTPEIIDILKNKKSYSASALSNYINCKLSFYLKSIAGLYEPDEVGDSIDDAVFGNIFHKAMEILYDGAGLLDQSTGKMLKQKIETAVDKAFTEEFPGAESRYEGRNLLLRKVILELVNQTLDSDLNDPEKPIHIDNREVDINLPFTWNGTEAPVTLQGIIDRVDGLKGRKRIVDYKTGNVEDKSSEDMAMFFTDPKYKILFQTFFYGLIYSKTHPNTTIQLGIYPLKKISDGIYYPKKKNASLTQDELDEFEKRLSDLFSELFDPNTPFDQTDFEERCAYCAFKDICGR